MLYSGIISNCFTLLWHHICYVFSLQELVKEFSEEAGELIYAGLDRNHSELCSFILSVGTWLNTDSYNYRLAFLICVLKLKLGNTFLHFLHMTAFYWSDLHMQI